MAANPNLDVMQRFITAALSGDAATLRTLAHPEFVLHEGSGMPFAGTFAGADGFLAFLGVFMETFAIQKLEPVRTYTCDDPDYIACEMELVATQNADGAPFESTLVEIWQFRDGQVLAVKPHYFHSPLHPA